jgi:hypothetical protein
MTSFRDLTPPPPDVVEVSVFGRGVGECVVIHVGHGDWIVVDSCLDDEKSPVATSYLDALGVDPAAAIKLIVVSHWHDDHTAGITELARRALAAKVVASAAFTSEEFKLLLAASEKPFMQPSGVDELLRLVALLRDRNTGGTSGIAWALADRLLFGTTGARVVSLSPSDATLERAHREIGELLPRAGQPRRRAVAHRVNELCVVLAVDALGTSILLGADLEGNRPGAGWHAVVSQSVSARTRAHVYKAAHHGADNGDHAGIWSDLLVPSPHVVLTPYAAGRRPRPTSEDVERLLTQTNELYRAGPPRGRRSKERSAAVQKMIRRVAPDLHVLEGRIGHVRVRAQGTPPRLSVDCYGAAEKLAS